MQVLITKVDAVRDHGDTLTIITVGEHEVVANKQEDGTPRWVVGEPVIYVPEGAIVPDDVLKERGYWDEVKDKGLLEGKRGNRVKMRRFAGFESRGLLFKVVESANQYGIGYIVRNDHPTELMPKVLVVDYGTDVANYLGITEHVAG